MNTRQVKPDDSVFLPSDADGLILTVVVLLRQNVLSEKMFAYYFDIRNIPTLFGT